MSGKNRKAPSGSKSWTRRVQRRQGAKAAKRKFWTRARWLKHAERRQAARDHHPLPYIKSSRLMRQRELAVSAARSARMRAYNASRRAASAQGSAG